MNSKPWLCIPYHNTGGNNKWHKSRFGAFDSWLFELAGRIFCAPGANIISSVLPRRSYSATKENHREHWIRLGLEGNDSRHVTSTLTFAYGGRGSQRKFSVRLIAVCRESNRVHRKYKPTAYRGIRRWQYCQWVERYFVIITYAYSTA
jgi:hypothetical protein